jgi:hypothetical protein
LGEAGAQLVAVFQRAEADRERADPDRLEHHALAGRDGVHDLNGLRFDHLPALGARLAQGLQIAHGALGDKPVGKLLLDHIGSVMRFDFGPGHFRGDGLHEGFGRSIKTSFSILHHSPLALA